MGSAPFRAARKEPPAVRMLPFLRDLPAYGARAASRDALAGVTVAALAVPSAMAYAELAGLSPVNGLYALLLPTLAYALFGSSRVLIVGPEGSISVLVGAALLPLALGGSGHAAQLAATLALLVGACFLVARLIRLEWVADYLSRPVLTGYIHGVAIVLVVGQLGKLLGVSVSASNPVPELFQIINSLDTASGVTIAVSVVSLAALFACRRFASRVPATLVLVVVAIPLSRALDLAGHGVAVVGSVPSGLPSIALPSASATEIVKLLPAALAIFFVAFADEILTARSFAGRRSQHIRTGQELFAMGAADLAAGLSQGFPIGASGSRTAVNDSMRARTQISAALAATVVVVILLFLTGPMQYLPKPVLGAVIVAAAVGLVDIEAWRSLWRLDRIEFATAAVTTGGVVLIGVLNALVLAIALSIVDAIRRSARPQDAVLGWDDNLGRYADVAAHTAAKTTPGVVVYRLDDRLFFANAGYFKTRVLDAVRGAQGPVRRLVLDAGAVSHIDATGGKALETAVDELERRGIELSVARLHARTFATLETMGLVDRIGADRFYPTVRAAVAGALPPRAPAPST
jgi:SulP family sulfate permease